MYIYYISKVKLITFIFVNVLTSLYKYDSNIKFQRVNYLFFHKFIHYKIKKIMWLYKIVFAIFNMKMIIERVIIKL